MPLLPASRKCSVKQISIVYSSELSVTLPTDWYVVLNTEGYVLGNPFKNRKDAQHIVDFLNSIDYNDILAQSQLKKNGL